MSNNTLVLVIKIVAMFLVILVGWLARRRGKVDGATTGFLSTFTTDVALPCLIFTQLLNTVDQASLRASWPLPVMAFGVLLLGQIVGWGSWRWDPLESTCRHASLSIL